MGIIYLSRGGYPRRFRYACARVADGFVSFLTCGFFSSSFTLDHTAREARRGIEKAKREYDAQQNSRKSA